MRCLYSVFIRFYGLFIRVAALLHPKAKAWVKGRKNWKKDLQQQITDGATYIWIHCASAGEFEQAIPVIHAIRQKNATYKIAVSFFSPSGYEMYKDSNLVDVFFYLPLDTPGNAAGLLQILQPVAAIFIRNEFWWNILHELKQHHTPAYLINASRHKQVNVFYDWYLDRVYSLFTKIFDTATYGNTKLERVIENLRTPFDDTVLQHFCSNSKVLILGSSWKTETAFAARFYSTFNTLYPNLKIIIAPHEFDVNTYDTLCSQFNPEFNEVISYSCFKKTTDKRILFLDKKGILKYAYRYAHIALVGGGYEKTVHNVGEAVVYGIPAIFGPAYQKFEEIPVFIASGLAFPANDYESFEKTLLSFLEDTSRLAEIKAASSRFFATQQQMSKKIIDEIL